MKPLHDRHSNRRAKGDYDRQGPELEGFPVCAASRIAIAGDDFCHTWPRCGAPVAIGGVGEERTGRERGLTKEKALAGLTNMRQVHAVCMH
ncbi:MAG: hypothetical protein HY778_13290 [Betaproteobacteria bacterium]|nr:hypothetical protein [Betaproteobacteria bacterium]